MSAICFHCGLPLADASGGGMRWSTVIDGQRRAMCCPGCEAVAQAIVDNGLGDYYKTRTGYGVSAAEAAPRRP